MEKFTKKNIYTAMINFTQTGAFTFTDAEGATITVDNEALEAFATHELELLVNRAAKAKETKAAKAAEPDALTDAVTNALTDEFATIADIAALIEGEEVTVSKVTYRLNKLVEAGVAVKTDIKIPGGEGKRARTIKAFKRA